MEMRDYERYNRHLILEEIGYEGQKKLLSSRVLIVGVGGLGSPISIYLAASGVGTLGLVEFDTVDISNLQRQIMYDTDSIGMSKVLCAKKRIKSLNPNCNVEIYEEPLNKENAIEILKKYDYVVDATDNLKTRYLINDTCVLLGKTYVYGSIEQFEGRVTVFDSTNGPCYRCVFPEVPKSKYIPGGMQQGVLGVLPGIVGLMQSTEIIKLICNIGSTLKGKMILYDALEAQFNEMVIKKNENCPICGQDAMKELGNYSEIKGLEPTNEEIKFLEYDEVIKKNKEKKLIVLDVRDKEEFKNKNIKGSVNIPINSLIRKKDEINKFEEDEMIIVCANQERSIVAYKYLYPTSNKKLYVLKNGLFDWWNREDCFKNLG
ncbi:molybdopterin-synthase adenylyltransferase MoeB [Clostridium paraputrificum]|uniref:molybdopterin-synthase adenylyltransferase MoeB n=1 Tax=Clostridium paraputrificum TaxID=29363 RepID=UPI003D34053C